MASIVFIGDELTAAGFRLAGVETLVPQPGAVGDALSDARSRAGLVVITADCAGRLPSGELENVLLAEAPIVAVVPDILAHTPPPDLAGRLRAVLGIDR